MNSKSKAGRRLRHLALGIAAATATVGATGCGEKSEPDVHPPTTATPTATVPTTPPPGTTAKPAPGTATATTPKGVKQP